jgi:hypothetical protein
VESGIHALANRSCGDATVQTFAQELGPLHHSFVISLQECLPMHGCMSQHCDLSMYFAVFNYFSLSFFQFVGSSLKSPIFSIAAKLLHNRPMDQCHAQLKISEEEKSRAGCTSGLVGTRCDPDSQGDSYVLSCCRACSGNQQPLRPGACD